MSGASGAVEASVAPDAAGAAAALLVALLAEPGAHRACGIRLTSPSEFPHIGGGTDASNEPAPGGSVRLSELELAAMVRVGGAAGTAGAGGGEVEALLGGAGSAANDGFVVRATGDVVGEEADFVVSDGDAVADVGGEADAGDAEAEAGGEVEVAAAFVADEERRTGSSDEEPPPPLPPPLLLEELEVVAVVPGGGGRGLGGA